MPQLTSGRHVGINPEPLMTMIDDIINERTLALWPLLSIGSPLDCLKHFEVIYFEETQSTALQASDMTGNHPRELKPIPTGLRVTDVLGEQSDWSEEEKRDFNEFLKCERAQAVLQLAFEQVTNTRVTLEEHGSFQQKWQAKTWKIGCHPLQEDLDN